MLHTLEGNQLKRANNLSYHSKAKILAYAMGISPLEVYLFKRKLGFLIQLTNNEVTSELLAHRASWTLADVLERLNIDYDRDIVVGKEKYLTLIRQNCLRKLREINMAEFKIKKTELVRCIRYLLNNRNRANDDTIQYLLDPRRLEPG